MPSASRFEGSKLQLNSAFTKSPSVKPPEFEASKKTAHGAAQVVRLGVIIGATMPVHPVTSIVQALEHVTLPPSKPSAEHVCPWTSVPSHVSPASMRPFPQFCMGPVPPLPAD